MHELRLVVALGSPRYQGEVKNGGIARAQQHQCQVVALQTS